MENPIIWIDTAEYSENRIVLTENEIKIPGIRMFGCHNKKKKYYALVDHIHPDCIEVSYILSGNVSFSIEGEEFMLYPGDLLVTPANMVHNSNGKDLAFHSMYWFQIDVHNSQNFLFLQEIKAKELIDQLKALQPKIISLNQRLYDKLFQQIFLDLKSPEILSKNSGCYRLLFLLNQIIIESEINQTTINQTSDILHAIYYIKDHIKDSVTINEIAHSIGLSTSRFKQKFTDQIGMSPRVYINYQKIETAKEDLLKGYSITDTAMEYNFSSSNYFYVVFKRYIGKSPSSFIKGIKK